MTVRVFISLVQKELEPERLAEFSVLTTDPTRVVGINNIELDEYLSRAVREAFVNAFYHRNYEDTSRKIRI